MGILGYHREIAGVALNALRERKFLGRYGLGGGNALNTYGILRRDTEDIDLFLDREDGIREAADIISEALNGAGYQVDPVNKADELAGIWPEAADETLAEWEVTIGEGNGQHVVQVQAGFFTLKADPVTISGLQVIGLADVAGHKLVALANRGTARDLADAAALLERYTAAQLIKLAVERDPGLRPEYYVDAMQRLERLHDSRLAMVLRGTGRTPEWVRRQFADWPADMAAAEEWWANVTGPEPEPEPEPVPGD